MTGGEKARFQQASLKDQATAFISAHRMRATNETVRFTLGVTQHSWMVQQPLFVVGYGGTSNGCAPAHCRYTPVPDTADQRWNIWSIGHIDCVEDFRALGLNLALIRKVLARADRQLGRKTVPRSKSRADELFLMVEGARREMMEKGLKPERWTEDMNWWDCVWQDGGEADIGLVKTDLPMEKKKPRKRKADIEFARDKSVTEERGTKGEGSSKKRKLHPRVVETTAEVEVDGSVSASSSTRKRKQTDETMRATKRRVVEATAEVEVDGSVSLSSSTRKREQTDETLPPTKRVARGDCKGANLDTPTTIPPNTPTTNVTTLQHSVQEHPSAPAGDFGDLKSGNSQEAPKTPVPVRVVLEPSGEMGVSGNRKHDKERASDIENKREKAGDCKQKETTGGDVETHEEEAVESNVDLDLELFGPDGDEEAIESNEDLDLELFGPDDEDQEV